MSDYSSECIYPNIVSSDDSSWVIQGIELGGRLKDKDKKKMEKGPGVRNKRIIVSISAALDLPHPTGWG